VSHPTLKFGGSGSSRLRYLPDVVPYVVCVSVIPPSGDVIMSKPLLYSLLFMYDLYNS